MKYILASVASHCVFDIEYINHCVGAAVLGKVNVSFSNDGGPTVCRCKNIKSDLSDYKRFRQAIRATTQPAPQHDRDITLLF